MMNLPLQSPEDGVASEDLEGTTSVDVGLLHNVMINQLGNEQDVSL